MLPHKSSPAAVTLAGGSSALVPAGSPPAAQHGEGALAMPDKCCFNFQVRRIKRDSVVACYPTSPECPHQAVIFRVRSGKEICTEASRAWVKTYQQSFQVRSFSAPT
ncbi:C-C motif chemokine 4 isoform X1 [Cuculus canorus]|nr:C-C motif chemokine 4 isoform X1 [Cuculus canorus]XP_053941088.1 C-C motif chemokine 4 isoform X1 [Cuculus canorus]